MHIHMCVCVRERGREREADRRREHAYMYTHTDQYQHDQHRNFGLFIDYVAKNVTGEINPNSKVQNSSSVSQTA